MASIGADPEIPLLLTPRSPAEAREWLSPWSWLLGEAPTPLFLNLFGCAFLRDTEGIVLLDVFHGELAPLLRDEAALPACLADAAWRETYLLAGTVGRLRAAGLVTDARSCYALAPPTVAGGPDPWRDRIEAGSVMVVPVPTLQALASGAARAARRVAEE